MIDFRKETIALDWTRKVRPAGFASADTKHDPPPERYGRKTRYSYTHLPESAN
jgi:hypothetical protein